MRQLFTACPHSLFSAKGRSRAALTLLFALAALFFAACTRLPPLSTGEGRRAYLAALGWEADPASEELREIVLPAEFDAVLASYNRLQLAQGFDLRPAAGKRCLCVSYDLARFPDWDGRVIAVLYIFRGRVIGGDVHTADVRGFMLPLRRGTDS